MQWIISEARQPLVDPSILKGYEWEFRRQLEQLIQRTEDPELKQQFQKMLDCPITDSSGRCRDFSDYILATLIKHGIHHRYDVESALGYVMEKMLMDRSLTSGKERATLFGGFDLNRDFIHGTNPLLARFLEYLKNAVANIRSGRIARLATSHRAPGTLSIGPGRQSDDDFGGTVSPDQIAAKSSSHDELDLLLKDIRTLLQRKEPAYGLPLAAFFDDMMGGMRNVKQRQKYGETATKNIRQVIIQTIRNYAESSGNSALLQMLKRFENFSPNKSMETKRTSQKTSRPVLSPQVKDYVSIVSLVAKLGRPVGTSDLGKYRRRWLDYLPRDPDSHHRNRLDSTLEKMVDENILTRRPTGRGGYEYSPGPEFDRYKEPMAA